jgi:transposase
VRRYCEQCFEKQLKIEELLEEIQRLKAQLRYQERKSQEGLFGSSTPSSQRPLKANTGKENRNHKGGARPGHQGHGRKGHCQETADDIRPIDIGALCPDCGGP